MLGQARRAIVLAVALAGVVAPSAVAADGPPTAKQAWASWRAAPAAHAAQTGSFEPGFPPALCTGTYFADLIGTNGPDAIEAVERPERLWGRAGMDFLYGSDTRAACLFGGRDPDILDLSLGGGAAWGEHGSDQLTGSPIDDVLDGGDGADGITGGDGADAISGGSGIDGIDAGPGDDLVETADERAEIVECGPGLDTIVADRVDLLLGCESGSLIGPGPVRLVPQPSAARRTGIVRVHFRIPEAAGANAYRVVVVNSCAATMPTVTSFPGDGHDVRRGQLVRVGLRPPTGGWCPGLVKAAIVLRRPCRSRRGCAVPPPPEPVARLEFQAG